MFEGQVLGVAADASEDERTGLSWYEIEVAIGAAIGSQRDASMADRVDEAGNAITSWAAGAMAAAREWLPGTHEPADGVEAEATPAPATREADPGRPAHGSLFALSPGMPAEVHLRTGDRSPLSYLFKPLTDYFSRALREE